MPLNRPPFHHISMTGSPVPSISPRQVQPSFFMSTLVRRAVMVSRSFRGMTIF